MVFSLAPKAISMGLPNKSTVAVNIRDMTKRAVVQFPSIFSADSLSPFPIIIEERGAPPILIRAAKADTTMIMGMVTPMAVRAVAPTSGIWPI